jgi:succinate-semialdehyde dehydrogenase/glutarate-semialdehyde dehydrogenase
MRFEMLINGEWRGARADQTWNVTDPASEDVIAAVPFGGAAEAEAAVTAAHDAAPGWAALTPYARGALLRRVGELITAHLDTLAPIMTRECGKPLSEARAEWATCAALFDWYAEEGKRAYGRTVPSRHAHKRLLVTHSPVGVVATITAWNFPAFLPARYWSAALAAGCTVVGRPSELTPMSAMALVNLMHEAGLPPGVINLVNGEPAAMGEVFLRDPRVGKLCFTGSQRVGQLLMRGAADSFRRLSLELGGSAPVLVFADADPETAARQVVTGKLRNNGQTCIAPARVYVQRALHDAFVAAARAEIEKQVVGPGLAQGVTLGPLVNAAGRDKVESFVADALAKGATVVTGGQRPAQQPRGYFYAPTLLTGVNATMRISCDEVFGPVLPVSPFDTLADGVRLANDTPYGLAGYIITNDLATATLAYEGLRFGVIGVNDPVPSTPEAPFGGMNQSGIGREMGQEGLHEYLETKFVSIAL